MNNRIEYQIKSTGVTEMSIIINGRRINPNSLPDSGIYGKNLLKEMKTGAGRRAVIQRGYNGVETIQPEKLYKRAELINKQGQGLKVTSMPDRSKGCVDDDLI